MLSFDTLEEGAPSGWRLNQPRFGGF